MPINGGTRMLRARRKDINVKPNRRLDRKSSRGMLFENEELRMRTITINAEVEQGQHALKKLRRENEQLRREMWSLRDEYDKMEKLLRKKETDEDSDQENSDSDDNYSQTEDSDEENRGEGGQEEGNRALESGEAAATKFGNLTTARAFDGLSVIDEQTEETTTQTTESAFGATSRGDSANRTFCQAHPGRGYDDGGDFPPFFEPPYHQRPTHRRKGFGYDGDFAAFATTDWPDNGYDARPASPYPYPESVQPSYRKRFEVLQNLPPVASRVPAPRVDDNGWMFPSPAVKADYEPFPTGGPFAAGHYPPDKAAATPVDVPRELNYAVVQGRTGPDVFISGVCAKRSAPETADVKGGATFEEADRAAEDGIIKNVEAEIEKIEIRERRDEGGKTATAKEAPPGGEETAAADDSTNGQIDDSVPCQSQSRKDAQPAEDMARADAGSKFQSKLTVTLRTPPAVRAGTLRRVQVPTRTCQTLGYGGRSDGSRRYAPLPECRYAAPCGVVNDAADIPAVGAPPTAAPDGVVLDTEDIPVQHMPDGLGLLTEAETVPHLGVPAMKPIKIPPAPPPRTTSCLGSIIPDSPIGVTALHHRTFRGGKPPIMGHQEPIEHYDPFMHNPLMLSEPMATSSPRMLQRGHNLSLDNLSTHRPVGMGANPNDESSTEDVSSRRTRTTGRRVDPPQLNKSVSSPSFGTFLRRKASEHSVSSMENGASQQGKIPRGGNPQNNASVSSSSGLDSPTKSDRRKRRVSIKFNKKGHAEDVDERASDSRPGSGVRGSGKGRSGKVKTRNEETDVTTSERERTNSVSSRASSVGRRKLSVSSSRTYVNEEKIPWCGCWGNGCV